MCFAIIAHHVPHTTVPANRPHRPVSAPPKRSPPAETGQPVRTHYGVRGRRLARRLHPCALAVRPPFDARPKWSGALTRGGLKSVRSLHEGLTGKARRSEGSASREGKRGVRRCRRHVRGLGRAGQEASCARGLAANQNSIGVAPVEPARRQTGKLAEWLACSRAAVQAGTHNGTLSPGLRSSHADRLRGKYATCHLSRHAGMQTVTRAEVPAGDFFYLAEGRAMNRDEPFGRSQMLRKQGGLASAIHNLKKHAVDACTTLWIVPRQ